MSMWWCDAEWVFCIDVCVCVFCMDVSKCQQIRWQTNRYYSHLSNCVNLHCHANRTFVKWWMFSSCPFIIQQRTFSVFWIGLISIYFYGIFKHHLSILKLNWLKCCCDASSWVCKRCKMIAAATIFTTTN